jgi:hypothetical protein
MSKSKMAGISSQFVNLEFTHVFYLSPATSRSDQASTARDHIICFMLVIFDLHKFSFNAILCWSQRAVIVFVDVE